MVHNKPFTFAISLSVLDHLGRNLYRSFATVLGEAISNSWDANADNVWIYIDKKENRFFIKDDGDGMDSIDFQDKFLKIGYSKRKHGKTHSSTGRPFIGRKGIGKLALLSCANKIIVISKKLHGDYIGGTIDNSGLDHAIKEDLIPDNYPLETFDLAVFGKLTANHKKGTIICFEDSKEEIKHSTEFLRKTLALYFRFSLIDKSFKIFLDDVQVTLDDLNDLAENTEFLWNINHFNDPFVKDKLGQLRDRKFKTQEKTIKIGGKIKGFIASVKKPRNLKITNIDERVSVDLFVNGRLRERDILRYIPTDRLAVSYLYGQIHFDDLDDKLDRFTSSREGIVADDPKYKKFLETLKDNLYDIIRDWDEWRIKNREDGDPENDRITKQERSSIGLFNAVSEEYEIPEESKNKHKTDIWVDALSEDAKYNFTSYAECFISENLIRKYIEENKITFSKDATKEILDKKTRETTSKEKGNVSIAIRKVPSDSSYLSMDSLANLVDKRDPSKEACLSRDAKEYKPIRDALMHTALLTDEAKQKLTTVYHNMKGRVKTLLST